jgi:type II secretory pathway component PulJ
MGYSTLIDLVSSVIIGGLLLLILFRLNDATVENNYVYGGEAIAQSNLVEVVQLVEHDFRKIGYCRDWEKIPDPSKSILSATQNSIRFLTDENNDGNIDTIAYYLGPTSELVNTPNPNDRMLYRVLNNQQPRGANLGVTQFDLFYYDAVGTQLSFPITVPSIIYTMQINIKVEDVYGYDRQHDEEKYSSAFWRQVRLASRNLKNR